jgi:4-carboxymuconolactone decarboxylase
MARLPYPEPQAVTDKARELLDKLQPFNLFRMLSHSDHLFGPFVRFGNAFLFKGKLDPVLREIAILRVGYLSNASYEIHQHERLARSLAMSDALIDAIKQGPDADTFTPMQRNVMRFVDELVHNVRASDATFDPLRRELSIQQMQELTLVVGNYMMVCRFLETFDIDIETGSGGRP